MRILLLLLLAGCAGEIGEVQLFFCPENCQELFESMKNDYCAIYDYKQIHFKHLVTEDEHIRGLMHHKFCFNGNIIVSVDQLGLDKGFQTCQIYPEQFQVDCFTFMGNWISFQNLSADQIVEECNKAGEKYNKLCLESAFN